MSLKFNSRFRTLLSNVSAFVVDLFGTIFSVALIGVLSSFKVAHRNKNLKVNVEKACCVLGNGPSLKVALDNGKVEYKGNDVICVNLFCKSEYFRVIKPQYYFVSDYVYLGRLQTERHKQIYSEFVSCLNSVDWEMMLFLPTLLPEDKLLKDIQNPYISIQRVNTTWIKGFKHFRFRNYHRFLAIPRCENILGVVLTLMVSLNYKKILLYGADHSWTKDMFVDDDNVVCYGDRHVYNTNLQVIKMNHPLYVELSSFAMVFRAHHEIEEYAQTKCCQIFNCTEGSFIDAYKRK